VNSGHILEVALAAPVMRLFDYLPPTTHGAADTSGKRGQRILVPFGNTNRVGVLIRIKDESSISHSRLRAATRIIDDEPLLDEETVTLLEWAANYYQYPPGEVFGAALPGILRRGGSTRSTEPGWVLTADGRQVAPESIEKKARVQAKILRCAANHSSGLTKALLANCGASWRQSVSLLEKKGWLARVELDAAPPPAADYENDTPPILTDAQKKAVTAINQESSFAAFLLEGVTGSGKTEVYLRAIEKQLQEARQSLVLVPEIGLTPQLVERFQRRLATKIVAMHSGLSDGERMRAWCAARDGSAGVIIGTRSAVFTPLAKPGLIIVDEEHDSSLKQQDGFRYSARDLAVWRARQLNIQVVLGSATPSFESLENSNAGRYQRLELPDRPGNARQPEIRLIDLRAQPIKDGLTEPMRNAISRHLAADGQVLLYLNRRGYAPALLCTSCGLVAECRRCDSRMVLHQHRRKLVCHHCGAERTATDECSECAGALCAVGQGTERLEAALREQYPDHGIVRIDRDTTRRKGEIERRLDSVRSGASRLLLGTQMLTKGHDFPNVTLVGIIDADQGLFGTDFRSSERLAQSFIQVAGRAGRADRAGEVYIQTLFPDHPLLTVLITEGYRRFADEAMVERRLAGWPPFTFLALLRAESPHRPPVFDFLNAARDIAHETASADMGVLGPAPAPMERRSGRFRGQLLIRATSRADMQRFLQEWRKQLDGLKSARKTRWSLDIDPVELF
jgi:primosomal protein N' (replication factor Y)